MPLRRVASALVALAIVLAAASAQAERRKVALVNANGVLEQQVRIALSAWDLEVQHVDWTSLSSGMPGAAIEARQVAAANKVDAVVWISETGNDHALWVYDARVGHIVTRPLPMAPPTDAPNAASVALTLKTLMRSTTAAPPSERLGAPERAVGPIGVFRAEADGGARSLNKDFSKSDLRVAINALWFPQLFEDYAGLALGFSAGPGVAVRSDDGAFSGRFLDLALSPALRFRLPLGELFTLEPQSGVTIHFTSLDGGEQNARRTRTDPSLDGSLLFSFALTRAVDLGARAGIGYLFKYQHYAAGSATVLDLSPIQLSGSLVLGARLN